ncbi:MAG: glycerate kinase [Glaciecola sp.]
MRILVAPDSFGGSLTPLQAAQMMASGWLDARPDDEVVLRPMSDGGEGLLDAVGAAIAGSARPPVRRTCEVAGPLGLPLDAAWLLLEDGTAIIESALACGLALVSPERRDPRMTTTWGVGQLLEAAANAGASRVLLGLGGSATVDGGAGALSALGWRITVADGSGLKMGGEDLARVTSIAAGWVTPAVAALSIELLADVTASLGDAAATFGPQKGADHQTVEHLTHGLEVWADVVETTFGAPGLRAHQGAGAAGGLGFALQGAHGAALVVGASRVASLVGLQEAVRDADLVLTGEGRFDATSLTGKVVGTVAELAASAGTEVIAVCGQLDPAASTGTLREIVAVSPHGPPEHAGTVLREAVAALARQLP